MLDITLEKRNEIINEINPKQGLVKNAILKYLQRNSHYYTFSSMSDISDFLSNTQFPEYIRPLNYISGYPMIHGYCDFSTVKRKGSNNIFLTDSTGELPIKIYEENNDRVKNVLEKHKRFSRFVFIDVYFNKHFHLSQGKEPALHILDISPELKDFPKDPFFPVSYGKNPIHDFSKTIEELIGLSC